MGFDATDESLRGVAVVRVIGLDGSLLGDMPTEAAQHLAKERGLSLMQLGLRTEHPPLCRLVDTSADTAAERRNAYIAMIERERSEPGSRFPSAWRDVWQPIAETLMNEWNPIGVRGVPEAVDEYDTYVRQIHGMLERGTTAVEIETYLTDVQTKWMGMGEGDRTKQRMIAEHLLRWWSSR